MNEHTDAMYSSTNTIISIQLPVHKPEPNTTHSSQNSHHAIIPHEQRIITQAHERLGQCRRERIHEQRHRLHEGPHILRRLHERILQRGDIRKDLGYRTKHIRHSLHPDRDIRMQTVLIQTLIRGMAAWIPAVDVELRNCGSNHRTRSDQEAGCYALEGRELDADPAEEGVEYPVHDGDEDDQGKGVEVVDDVVGDAAEVHCCCLGGEVVEHLIVGQVCMISCIQL